MDKNMQRAMLSAFDDLRNRLITATQPKTSVDLIDSTFAMSSIGGRGLEQLREAAAAAAVLGQMEAVCRFLLEILYPAGVGEGVDDLLAAESDEIDSLREFPNLGILRGLLDSRGDAGSAGDVPLASSSACRCVSMILLLTVRPARRKCGMTPSLGEGRAVLLTPPGIAHAKEARDGRRYDVRCAR